MKQAYENIKHYTMINTGRNGVHWVWWVMWLLIFWPTLIIVAVVHFSENNTTYRVLIEYKDGEKEVVLFHKHTFENEVVLYGSKKEL